MEVKVKMSILKDIAYEASAFGAKLPLLCKNVGLSVEDLDQGELWVGLEKASAVWEEAVKQTNNTHLGFHIGQKSNPYVIGIVGYLIESSPDIFTALDNICKFNAIYADMFNYYYEIKDNVYYLYFTPAYEWWNKYPDTARQAIETSMARTLSIIKKFTGKSVLPLKALFNYEPPASEVPYQKFLKTNLYFNVGVNALVFDLDVLKLPVASYNQALYEQFQRIAFSQLEKLKDESQLSSQIEQQLYSNFDQSLPSIQLIAEQLGLSVRTLQRRLKTEGHTFQELTDRVRKDMALEFIKNQKNSIGQIASFLGYSDPSVFRRAFKRWTGKTPKEFITS